MAIVYTCFINIIFLITAWFIKIFGKYFNGLFRVNISDNCSSHIIICVIFFMKINQIFYGYIFNRLFCSSFKFKTIFGIKIKKVINKYLSMLILYTRRFVFTVFSKNNLFFCIKFFLSNLRILE